MRFAAMITGALAAAACVHAPQHDQRSDQAAGRHGVKEANSSETSTRADLPEGHGHRHGALAMKWSLPRRLIDGKNGAVLEPGQVFTALLSSRVIYVSEQHNNPHHHAAQLSVIAGVYARDPSVAIGMEMFKRPFQHALDDYLDGKIDEEELVEKSEWEDRWGYDFDLYRPILEFARAHHIHVLALNAPDEITRTVADHGVKALSETERKSLPDLDLSNKDHREMLREIYEEHHAHASGSFEDFYAAQVIWDETMAYEVARALKDPHGPKRVVVLAGDGHIRYGLGIPQRAARRGATPFKTVLPVMLHDLDDAVSEASSDYLWVMAMNDSDLPKGERSSE
jgi:uncharacterized iron-regulated protein